MYIEFRNDLAFQHVYLADGTVETYGDNESEWALRGDERGDGRVAPVP